MPRHPRTESMGQPDVDPIPHRMGARCHASARWITPTPWDTIDRPGGRSGRRAGFHQDHGVATIRAHEETGVGWSYGRDLGVASWSKQHGIRFEDTTNGVIRGLIDWDHWSPLRDASHALARPSGSHRGHRSGTDIPTVSELGLTARPLTDRPEPGELCRTEHGSELPRGPWRALPMGDVRARQCRHSCLPVGPTSVLRKREHPTTRSDGGG